MKRTYSAALGALLMSGVLAGGCAQTDETRIPADALLTGETFVSIPKPDDAAGLVRQAASSTPIISPKKGDDFYLAIKKTELGNKWFLSAFMKQFYPDNVNMAAARALGTRVVSFKVQNGKLFMFDSSDQYHASDLFDPQILVEAYPVVTGYAPFESLASSDKYVLFDPAAGLNKFSLHGDTFADPYLSRQTAGFDFSIGVSFMQSFRKIADGVTYEQVFTGQGIYDDGVNPAFTYRASGTLGVGLRKYQEGAGFTRTPYADDEYYFRSDRRALPDTGGFTSNPIKWNLKKGNKPITFYIGRGILEAQADYPEFDVIGAAKRGIEGWNDVLGYQAFKAEVAPEDVSFGDSDVNMLAFDYPGVQAGYAFANWRTNPNTGEILEGNIYGDGVWMYFFDAARKAAANPGNTAPPTNPNMIAKPETKPQVIGLTWGGMRPEQDPTACIVWASKYNPVYSRHLAGASPAPAAATDPKVVAEHQFTHVWLHEMGHVLGLRHNFKGSLVPPSSSVMDYLTDDDSSLRDTPGAYDVAAIKYLYGLSPDYPNTAPFCNDSGVSVDPDCAPFDFGADPMHELWGDYYAYYVDLFVFQFGFPPDFLDMFGLTDGLLSYARAGADEDQAVAALKIGLDKGAAPVDPAATSADPYFGPAADALAIYVLKRLWTDPPELRASYITNDPFYTGVYQSSLDQLKLLVKNADNVRSYESRRASVDILKKFQTLDAYQALVDAKGLLQAQLASGQIASSDVLSANDLLARINAATNPYFVH
jgi:hypothetical protein